jgi:Putative phage serine protease XkdF
MTLNLFVPITKIDEEKRLVFGRIAEETPDSGGEVFDYETSKPYFQEWAGFFQKATDGKSYGNVRVQHDPKRNAGHLTDIAMLDEAKAIEACAKVNDDDEWQRIMDGDYTGFSIGGKYIKKWTDGGFKKYTAQPNEVSIVDYPMHKDCTFQLIKADGNMEEHGFKKIAADDATPAAKKGDNPSDMRKAEILADLNKWAGQEISDAMVAASCLSDIVYLFTMEETEDHPEAAAQVAALQAVITNLKAFIASEITETDPGDVIKRVAAWDEENLQKLCDALDLQKKGAMISKDNLTKIQAIHDNTIALGANCGKDAADPAGEMQKVAGERDEALEKINALTAEKDELQKAAEAFWQGLIDQDKRIKELEAEPAAAKGVLKTASRTFGKAEDTPLEKEETIVIDPNDPKSVEAAHLAMVKAAHGKPQRFEMRPALVGPEDLK